MRGTTVTISELELDGETAFKIANCIKKHEPEIWKGLSRALKQALPKPNVVGLTEQLTCPRCKSTNILNPDKDNDAQCIECAFIWVG